VKAQHNANFMARTTADWQKPRWHSRWNSLLSPDQVAVIDAYILSPESGVMKELWWDYDQNVVGAYPE
jgi:hypothetical protein